MHFFPPVKKLRDPSLRGKPHAVIMTPEKEGNITRGAVASCSYEARKYGVRSAISLLKAKELCPHLILKPVDKQYYGQISNKVMMLLEEYADILEKASIDEAYLDSGQIKSYNINTSDYDRNKLYLENLNCLRKEKKMIGRCFLFQMTKYHRFLQLRSML